MPNLSRASFDSPYYPYKKVVSGANTLKGAEKIPQKIILYLLDLPDAQGYGPADDNSRPRVRLAKYLWHDEPIPLSKPLPTTQEKLSMYFDPENPVIATDEEKEKHPKGFRIFPQRVIGQSILKAKTQLKIYPGRIIDADDFSTVIGIQIEIWSNVNLVANTKTDAIDRVFDIEQCLRESLVGVDIAGVGCMKLCRNNGSFNGSEPIYTDSSEVGRCMYFSVNWAEGGGDVIKTY